MYMRKLNFYLTSSAENMTTFSLYKRKILNPPPYQIGCLLAHFACLNPLLNRFFSEIFLLACTKNMGWFYIGGYTRDSSVAKTLSKQLPKGKLII